MNFGKGVRFTAVVLALSLLLTICSSGNTGGLAGMLPGVLQGMGLLQVSADDTEEALVTVGGGTARTSYLMVREEPRYGCDTFEELYVGDTFLVTGYSSDGLFCEIIYQGRKAYLSAFYVQYSPIMEGNCKVSGQAYIQDSYADVYEGPDENSAYVGAYSKGSEVEMIGVYKDWIAVVVDGQYGYVHSRSVDYYESDAWKDGSDVAPAELTVDQAVAQKIWTFCKGKGLTDEGAAGLMGNIYAESGMQPGNLENWANKLLGYLDKEFVKAVDSGEYSKDDFVDDYTGFGLCQWTLDSRKEGLYEATVEQGKSIADVNSQMEYLFTELDDSYYSGVLTVLRNTNDIKEATDEFMCDFENPANQESAARRTRLSYSLAFYKMFSSSYQEPETTTNAVAQEGTFAYLYASETGKKLFVFKKETEVTVVVDGEEWSRLSNGWWVKTNELDKLGE